MTFLNCLRPQVRKNTKNDDVKTQKIPKEQLTIDRFVTLIVQSYFDTLLRYVLSVTFCGAVVMKVIDQKTLVKRR